jgi:large subunit ribosomal protein L23
MQDKHKLYDIILKPLMSEKASNMSDLNKKYVFFVRRDAKKSMISKSVEFIFSVKVDSVNIINTKAKKVRFKGVQGKQSSKKKAIVTLADGYKIDLSVGA